jgi:hypothetical protein
MNGHLPVVLWVALEVLAVVVAISIAVWGFFRWDRRYRGARDGDGFQPTGELFKDPTTGRQMQVFFDQATGRRQYREI